MTPDAHENSSPETGIDHLPWARYRGGNVHFGEMRCLAIAPDGSRLAFGCGTTYANAKPEKNSAVIVVADLRSGAEAARLEGSRGTVYALAFSPEGDRLASYDVRHSWSGSPVRTARIWEIEERSLSVSKQCTLHATVN